MGHHHITMKCLDHKTHYLLGTVCPWTRLVVIAHVFIFAAHRVNRWFALGHRVLAIVVARSRQYERGYKRIPFPSGHGVGRCRTNGTLLAAAQDSGYLVNVRSCTERSEIYTILHGTKIYRQSMSSIGFFFEWLG